MVLDYINNIESIHGIGLPTTCGYQHCGKKICFSVRDMVTYISDNFKRNVDDSILLNMKVYVKVGFLMLFSTINTMNNLTIVVRS